MTHAFQDPTLSRSTFVGRLQNRAWSFYSNMRKTSVFCLFSGVGCAGWSKSVVVSYSSLLFFSHDVGRERWGGGGRGCETYGQEGRRYSQFYISRARSYKQFWSQNRGLGKCWEAANSTCCRLCFVHRVHAKSAVVLLFRDGTPLPSFLYKLVQNPSSVEQGLKFYGKISSCYTIGLYLRTLDCMQQLGDSLTLTDQSISGIVEDSLKFKHSVQHYGTLFKTITRTSHNVWQC